VHAHTHTEFPCLAFQICKCHHHPCCSFKRMWDLLALQSPQLGGPPCWSLLFPPLTLGPCISVGVCWLKTAQILSPTSLGWQGARASLPLEALVCICVLWLSVAAGDLWSPFHSPTCSHCRCLQSPPGNPESSLHLNILYLIWSAETFACTRQLWLVPGLRPNTFRSYWSAGQSSPLSPHLH
jgi:hypothetical protein